MFENKKKKEIEQREKRERLRSQTRKEIDDLTLTFFDRDTNEYEDAKVVVYSHFDIEQDPIIKANVVVNDQGNITRKLIYLYAPRMYITESQIDKLSYSDEAIGRVDYLRKLNNPQADMTLKGLGPSIDKNGDMSDKFKYVLKDKKGRIHVVRYPLFEVVSNIPFFTVEGSVSNVNDPFSNILYIELEFTEPYHNVNIVDKKNSQEMTEFREYYDQRKKDASGTYDEFFYFYEKAATIFKVSRKPDEVVTSNGMIGVGVTTGGKVEGVRKSNYGIANQVYDLIYGNGGYNYQALKLLYSNLGFNGHAPGCDGNHEGCCEHHNPHHK